eukprot:scaffold169_cov279-Chaetoceros_neogracile.AAC.15
MPKVFCILFPSPGSDYIETSNIIIDLCEEAGQTIVRISSEVVASKPWGNDWFCPWYNQAFIIII